MTLRDSLDLIRLVRPHASTAVLEQEIKIEQLSSLAAAERRVKAGMAALASGIGNRDDHLMGARQAVWEYFVQRELCGFRRHTDVIQDLKITPEVLNGLGISNTMRRR